MSRIALSILTLFLSSFFIAGCEPKNEPATPPPSGTTPTPPPKDDKKTSAAPAPAGAPLAAAVTAAATAAESSTAKATALTCGKTGCTQPGKEGTSLVHAGKALTFCCDGCRGEYKKANNIQ